MKALLDTSVLVSAHLPPHPYYRDASRWLSAATQGSFGLVVSAHSLAETYSVLTRIPATPRITPAAAWQLLVENVLPCATLVGLTGDAYTELLQQAAVDGLAGGVIYDVIIAKAAEIAGVDCLLTLNVRHFERVWPAGAGRIASPTALDPPAFVEGSDP